MTKTASELRLVIDCDAFDADEEGLPVRCGVTCTSPVRVNRLDPDTPDVIRTPDDVEAAALEAGWALSDELDFCPTHAADSEAR